MFVCFILRYDTVNEVRKSTALQEPQEENVNLLEMQMGHGPDEILTINHLRQEDTFQVSDLQKTIVELENKIKEMKEDTERDQREIKLIQKLNREHVELHVNLNENIKS